MTVINVSIAAATATLGFDLFKDIPLAQTPYARVLKYFGMKGSAVAGDTKVDLMIGEKVIGSFYNTGTGFPSGMNTDYIEINAYVPANARIYCIVTDAPVTNPINPSAILNP